MTLHANLSIKPKQAMANCYPLYGCLVLASETIKSEYLLSQKLYVKMLAISLLVGCASGNAPPIMTDEKFDSRVNANGKTEFAYGISWKNTSQASLMRDGRQEIERPRGDPRNGNQGNQRLAIQANNQTKMNLEDQAALALKQRLEKEQLCDNGYDINNVIWHADSIRLLGYCFD